MSLMRTSFVELLARNNQADPAYCPMVINKLTGTSIQVGESPGISNNRGFGRMVFDVPDYLETKLRVNSRDVTLKKIPQYKGYVIDLTKFENAEDFFMKTLGKNSRKNFRAKQRKLEEEYNIEYAFYFGEISKEQYDLIFDVCYRLMEERFDEKKIYNRNLAQWADYHKLFYPMILAKKASVFVIYDGDKPITITLNFHCADIVFSHIQIYDIAYSRFSMGDIAIFKNVGWCFQNNMAIWDFSKGATDNKLRWSNHVYQFDYHLIINKRTAFSNARAWTIGKVLAFKQLLRDKGVIGGNFQLDRWYYFTKMKSLRDRDWKKP